MPIDTDVRVLAQRLARHHRAPVSQGLGDEVAWIEKLVIATEAIVLPSGAAHRITA